MGRGGAVLAGLMSNKFYKEKNIPIFMVDRDIIHGHRTRNTEIKTDILDLVTPPKSVLLIGGVNASGGTFEKYSSWLNTKGVEKIRVCVLVESKTSKFQADYCDQKIAMDPTELKMPWYKGGIIDWQPPSYPNN
jgi:hypoxanthine-guanine phosphoribosyltransferase